MMITRSTTSKGFWGFAAALALTCLLTLLSEGRASAQTSVPGDLIPEAGNVKVLSAYGVGVQIYQSVASPTDPTTFVWKFVAPEATLFNPGGQVIARHFGGPSWESNSGSLVVGTLFKSVPSPDPDAIPWLLVKAVTNTGPGLFANVSFIQRLNTTGGKAPSTNPTQAGLLAKVPYTATYVFFVGTGN
jgi:hypothetical protein